MIDLFRYIAAAIFGWRWVVLTDFDGERSVRRIRWYAGKPCAVRIGFSTRVFLNDHGKVSGVSYVHGWEPYELKPFARRERRWPIPPPPREQQP